MTRDANVLILVCFWVAGKTAASPRALGSLAAFATEHFFHDADLARECSANPGIKGMLQPRYWVRPPRTQSLPGSYYFVTDPRSALEYIAAPATTTRIGARGRQLNAPRCLQLPHILMACAVGRGAGGARAAGTEALPSSGAAARQGRRRRRPAARRAAALPARVPHQVLRRGEREMEYNLKEVSPDLSRGPNTGRVAVVLWERLTV